MKATLKLMAQTTLVVAGLFIIGISMFYLAMAFLVILVWIT